MFNNSMSSEPIFVTILCLTYNHESYIRQCLDEFVMQQTNFRFEAIVHDDASTDSTTDIIREYAEKYPDIIKPIYETENQYSKHDGSLGRIMTAAVHGKYVAFCEGDDYWTDPLKLQKQIDFLESHPDYGAVYTDFDGYVQETGERKDMHIVPKSGWVYEDMLCSKLDIWTLTVCVRAKFVLNGLNVCDNEIFTGDILLFLYITSLTKVHCLYEKTAVYRILKQSASHFIDLSEAIKFQYITSNAHRYFLMHGPEVSKQVRQHVLRYSGSRRIRYACTFRRQDVLINTEYSFNVIKSLKDFICYLLCKAGQYNCIFKLICIAVRFQNGKLG